MRNIRFPQLITLFALMGVLSTVFLVNFSNKKTELRGRAQAAGIQVQCSPSGTVQFAISFTNPEAYPIDLLADILLQEQTISRNYANITPGKTQTDIIRTNLTSLSNTGDVVFTWYAPNSMPDDGNNTTASFNSITCNPSMPSSSPTTTVSNGETMDNSLLALTPLPPQPEVKPQPFYQPLLDGVGTKVQTLIYNLFRFIGAFVK